MAIFVIIKVKSYPMNGVIRLKSYPMNSVVRPRKYINSTQQALFLFFPRNGCSALAVSSHYEGIIVMEYKTRHLSSFAILTSFASKQR